MPSGAQRVILLVNSWVQLTTVLNELARSMGQHDFYPFVMSRAVLRKLHFIQMVVKETRGGTSVRHAAGLSKSGANHPAPKSYPKTGRRCESRDGRLTELYVR